LPGLRELQRGFARSLITGADAALESALESDAVLAAGERLAIYRNTFTGTLVNALRITYPVVEKLVGAEFFEAAARRFIAQEVPRSGYLNDYGDGFAEFLAGFAPAASLPYLADVARLEWAFAGAASAEDAPALDAAALAQRRPEELELLRLVPHPSLRVIDLSWPVDAVWQMITAGQEDALSTVRMEAHPIALLLHRGPNGVILHRLAPGERALADRLISGAPLGEALAVGEPVDAMAQLAEHLASGRFTAAEL
jgi:hypothetical protein